jgi:NAD(P)-dependent dehydrogenase (short-subunit alcohol dehydrogenase family)
MPNAMSNVGDLLDLSGRRALITGAAAGIGRAIAVRFAQAGAHLELADINETALQETIKDLSEFPVETTAHVLDISDAEQRRAMWDSFADSVPDILVNNAGIYPFRDFLDVDEAFYRRVLAINLDSVYWMCQEMIRRRLKEGGVIINIGSIEAVLPVKESVTHYSVSKAGVVALTRALAKEHGKDGFRINALLPGGIITEGAKEAAKGLLRFDLSLVRTGIEFGQRLPIRRLGKPDEVARMVLVLASDLSSYVHGAAIPVDGGFLSA